VGVVGVGGLNCQKQAYFGIISLFFKKIKKNVPLLQKKYILYNGIYPER